MYLGVHKDETQKNLVLALPSVHVLQTGFCMHSSLSKHLFTAWDRIFYIVVVFAVPDFLFRAVYTIYRPLVHI